MIKKLSLLLVCLFVVTIGLGVSLPVLPFFFRHLHSAAVPRETIVIHTTFLTSIYAFVQLIASPFWGQWSDRVGRRPLILLGIAGSAVAQVLFGLASSVAMLYVVRALGGFLSAAMLPAATAYVADITTDRDRAKGMALVGTASSLGAIVGPAFGGLTTREDIHFTLGVVDLKIENYAPPFFLAAALMFLTLLVAFRWLPESLSSRSTSTVGVGKASRSRSVSERREASRNENRQPPLNWQRLGKPLLLLLGLTTISQFGLTLFEVVFALQAQDKLGYSPIQTGYVFMMCGGVMTVFQIVAVSFLTRYVSSIAQVGLGFTLMGSGIFLLLVARSLPIVLGVVAIMAFGMALITPNLIALISKRSSQHTGTVLGIQNTANSLGQVGGAMLGGVLFAWQFNAPYGFTGVLLVGTGLLLGWRQKDRLQRL
ncbi:MFS transporter [Chamaesiphon minutus]|uniref:Arabinose efflux permease family protein n=1 Tax=Chamaesiphon minutus (strain ATCC 27169 / PCC 6605) TaxID=1173020 RepID=K9UQ14_CHAP6|nr:MFS transporter [Chamaesiphon minutus]AFY96900.1 arabinose efflux permease family protein [Chamaesiphon minutus PCC 6605]